MNATNKAAFIKSLFLDQQVLFSKEPSAGLWQTPAEDSPPIIEKKPLFSGLLFSISKQWHRAKFYSLFKDRLVLISKKDLTKEKRHIDLQGVHLTPFEDLFPGKDRLITKPGFILSRKAHYELFFTGTQEMHALWLQALNPYCILHKFKRTYKITSQISKGTLGCTVSLGVSMTGKPVAVKEFLKSRFLPSNDPEKAAQRLKMIENEIFALKMLKKAGTPELYAVFESRKRVRLVLEYMPGGDLYSRIIPKEGFSESQIKTVLTGVLKTLAEAHEKGLMHRDIKPENVLFCRKETWEVKLADFGLSERLERAQKNLSRCGTPGYVAPEVLAGLEYDQKCDVFSLGVVLYIMVAGKPLFQGENLQEVLRSNSKAEDIVERLDFGIGVKKQCVDLIQKMLKIDQKKRISAIEALEHPWLKVVNRRNSAETMPLKPEFFRFGRGKESPRSLKEEKQRDETGSLEVKSSR